MGALLFGGLGTGGSELGWVDEEWSRGMMANVP